ncbi:MAG: hypothetical protein HY815_07845 [Candidatus Riflebacteria bacterium]|nr:hypothetical protein [Candidatus Riflebacteria bacterium]
MTPDRWAGFTPGQQILTPNRWAGFTPGQQILMIANEMNRSRKLVGGPDVAGLRRGYERVLALVDLTIGCSTDRSLRRELLRWRDLPALLYTDARPAVADHDRALRVLLTLSPEAYPQIELLLGRHGTAPD